MNQKIVKIIRNYFAGKPVSKAWLFGSYSRGEETQDSDIDILVEFMPNHKIGLQYFRMLTDLESLCARPIDLVEKDMVDPYVAPYIEQDKILIYERAN